MALGYAWFDSYDSVGYVLTLHICPPYSRPEKKKKKKKKAETSTDSAPPPCKADVHQQQHKVSLQRVVTSADMKTEDVDQATQLLLLTLES